MTKRISAFLLVIAIPACLLTLLIHTRWLLFTSLGALLLVAAVYYFISPSRTGHVTDNLVSLVIVSILIAVFAITTQRRLDRSSSKQKGQTGMLTPEHRGVSPEYCNQTLQYWVTPLRKP